jgi:Resolvase, N terminal domain
MMTSRRAAIYCRISQTDPRTHKVENQEQTCRELAAREGYEVVAVMSSLTYTFHEHDPVQLTPCVERTTLS